LNLDGSFSYILSKEFIRGEAAKGFEAPSEIAAKPSLDASVLASISDSDLR
jgi:hypothetical protein